MEQRAKDKVRQILYDYLAGNNLHKSREREHILNAVLDMKGPFSLRDLNEVLKHDNFRVSRATLYNTIGLFQQLCFVVKHQGNDGVCYEVSLETANHLFRICTVCGKRTEVKMPSVTEAVFKSKSGRFLNDHFTLYVYGICGACRMKMKKRKTQKQNTIK
ncbi:MAG: Fur family transcriptional regulator [Prevotella sp.]|jgi:Fur family ferric uptake transcriptional regulator